MVDPTNGRNNEGFSVGWGDKRLTARGSAAIAILIAGVVAGTIYLHDTRTLTQLGSLAYEIRVQTCVQSLTFAEREMMRKQVAPQGQRWATVLEAWCPWLLTMDRSK